MSLALNRLNLIGVYGSATVPSRARALPTGRFVKLKVGDRLDGGQVAQIGPDRLLYQKGSRNARAGDAEHLSRRAGVAGHNAVAWTTCREPLHTVGAEKHPGDRLRADNSPRTSFAEPAA